jgi:heptosyltransferase-2
MLRAGPALADAFAPHRAGTPRPTLFASPHLGYWESQTALGLLVPPPLPEFAVIFRPLDNPAADAWMKRARERFGMRLLSRKAGFQEAMQVLRRRGFLGVLFDQNAGLQGALSLLFDRVCSTSELTGLLAEKFGAEVYVVFPRRLGFWRVEVNVARVDHDGTAGGVTLALNRWLETRLRADEDLCASWLWAHDRWRNQDIPARRLRLEAKRNLLDADLRLRGLAGMPRRTRLWIRLPNWLGDVVLALPLLRAIRASRPDAELTVLARASFLPWLESTGVADRVRPLPPRGAGYFRHFWRLRHEYPDCWINLTNSFRGDLEAWLTRCRQRFGLRRPGRPRPLLSHGFSLPEGFDERRRHQVELWELYLRHFGLAATPDFTPLRPAEFTPPPGPPVIGLICGSENAPEKRWPVAHWRELITALAAAHPAARFRLFGTAGDRPITDEVAAGLAAPVENLAGHTDLAGFAAGLAGCRLLVTNDTGGMHLANALGVPVVALFGPTSPLRTGPVFRAPVRLLQPPGCPPDGGARLVDLAPPTVLAAVRESLA